MYGKYTHPTDPMGGEICEDDIWMFFGPRMFWQATNGSDSWKRFVIGIFHVGHIYHISF